MQIAFGIEPKKERNGHFIFSKKVFGISVLIDVDGYKYKERGTEITIKPQVMESKSKTIA